MQDYSEEFRDIGGVKGKGKAQLPEGGIALIANRIVTDDLPVNFTLSASISPTSSFNLTRLVPYLFSSTAPSFYRFDYTNLVGGLLSFYLCVALLETFFSICTSLYPLFL